ncbi:MAG: glycosyltransferase family 1 protein [Chloroflexota bacterium]|nr:glycosyltransferase family 1 protein [Chloroflexota bacterium]
MRIGIDYTSAAQQRAGIGRYTRGLIKGLASFDPDNRYVLFSAGHKQGLGIWASNFTLKQLPITERQLTAIWQRLRLPLPVELITGLVDVYHSPDFVLPPVLAARTVLTVHDLSFMRHPECSSEALLDYLMEAVPRSVERADLVVADSESTRRDLMELLQVPDEKILVVYPGLESHFAPVDNDYLLPRLLQRYGVRYPYILAVGTLQPRKNFVRLIKAYDILVRYYQIPHKLVIVGNKGWLYGEIEETIQNLGLEGRVILTGFVKDQDLPYIYSAAEVFAFPSLYEGFGIPILEAMGCGTPVVTSSVSSMPEVAGDAALLVEPYDVEAMALTLWRLINDVQLQDELRLRGFKQARKFRWRDSAKKLVRAYRRLFVGGR